MGHRLTKIYTRTGDDGTTGLSDGSRVVKDSARGRAIGSTNASGANTVDPGWSRNRDIKPEDIEATIYSALGINWTTIRYDDPLGRGYYYVPNSDTDVYGPINELWA